MLPKSLSLSLSFENGIVPKMSLLENNKINNNIKVKCFAFSLQPN